MLILVYCLTMPTYGMGTIFTMGLTAALAWELPNEPIHLKDKNKEDSADKRVDVVPSVKESLEEKLDTVTYYQRPWSVNAYNNYLVTSKPQYIKTGQGNILSEKYHPSGHFIPIDYRTDYTLPAYRDERVFYHHREPHRRTRRDLYGKIEKFFTA